MHEMHLKWAIEKRKKCGQKSVLIYAMHLQKKKKKEKQDGENKPKRKRE